MKCKSWSNKINNFVVRKLKSFKINGQQKISTVSNTMPTIPNEKVPQMPLAENCNFGFGVGIDMKVQQQQKKQQQQQNKNNILFQTVTTGTKMGQKSPSKFVTAAAAVTSAATGATANGSPIYKNNENCILTENLLTKLSLTAQDLINELSDGKLPNGCSNDTSSSTSSSSSSSSSTNGKMSIDDYHFGRSVGEGSFSTVFQAKDIHTNKEYAIKVCDKQQILRERKQEYVRREREAMQIMNNIPGFVNLNCTFQDYENLYFVMTYAKHGDLLPYIQKVGSFDLECTRYYAAELLISIEHMHKKGIIHRDLKPENILLDKDMHTLITDFGSVKILGSDSNIETSPNRRRRCSFVGTAQYVSPEVLLGQDVTRGTDLWALGCIIYQMLTGLYPFRGDNEYLIFKEILNLNLEFPEGFDRDAADLIRSLLKLNPEERIGFQDKIGRYESIRTHPFFDEINWDTVRKQQPPQICSCVADLHKDHDDEFLCSR